MREGAITSAVIMWVTTVFAVACVGLVVATPSRYNQNYESAQRFSRQAQTSTPIQWKDLFYEYSKESKSLEQKPSVQNPLQAFPFDLPLNSQGANIQFIVLPIPTPAIGNAQPAECVVKPDPQIDVRSSAPIIKDDNSLTKVKKDEPNLVQEPSYPSYINVDRLDQSVSPPDIQPSASSKEVVEMFLAQTPTAPHLPPVLLSEYDNSERIPHPDEDHTDNVVVTRSASSPAPNDIPLQQKNGLNTVPSRPRFSQSLMIRGELTVPGADYTEPYTAWWDAATGSSKVDFHGGSASSFRTIRADQSIERFEMHIDRSGETAVRRCGRGASRASSPLDTGHPVLPDINLFSFVGYEPDGRVERWRHTAVGGVGELGAVRGEALTLQHDLLLIRDANDQATPITYSVAVSSSVLGPNSDGYEHRYLDVRRHDQRADFFFPNIGDLCDNIQLLNASLPNDFVRLEPLREFVHPHRDPRYKTAIQEFKAKYNRQYADEAEEATRTAVLMQNMRFILAGNREGATFELGVNFLGDRLEAELAELRGVELEDELRPAELFPHSRSALRQEGGRLPERFDWRPKGGVSPVRFQGKCSSCWAFAVAGSVEGALFARTGKLVPLSEKSLVDCAHPFGGKGCKGSWPSHAFDYVQSRGLPALNEYPNYKPKVDTCSEDRARPVTRISAHVNVTENSETALKVAIRQHAPAVVIVDAKTKSFVFYKHGVLYDDRCGKTRRRLNHAVLAVGWGGRREPYFVLKNSWSEAWGERGYARVHSRSNTCGVLARPSYPRLEERDVVRTRARHTRQWTSY